MGASAVKKSDLPPGFTLDELPEGFTLDPAEAAPDETPSGYQHPYARFASGIGTGLLNLPGNLIRSLDPRPIAKLAYKLAKPPMLGQPYEGAEAIGQVAEGLKETGAKAIGMRGPEAMGETLVDLAPSALPIGGIMAKAGKYAKESRAGNVMQALGAGSPSMKAKVEKLVNAGELDLPISATAGSLREKLGVSKDAALTELKTAKGKLKDLPEVSVKSADDALKARRPVVEGAPVTTQPPTPAGFGRTAPKPVTKAVEGTGNPDLLNAIDSQIEELTKVAGSGKAMKPEAIQTFKEQLQQAAKKAYDVAAGTGKGIPATGDAAKMTAKALKEVLENSPGIPEGVRTRLSAANRAYKPLVTASELLEQYRLAQAGKPLISRGIAQLMGRGLVGNSLAPLGAAAGIEGAGQLQGVLWNTMSAATKAKVAPYLQSGDLQKAMQIALSAHIAGNAARRNQEPTP